MAIDFGGETIGLEALTQKVGQLIADGIESFHQIVWNFDSQCCHRRFLTAHASIILWSLGQDVQEWPGCAPLQLDAPELKFR